MMPIDETGFARLTGFLDAVTLMELRGIADRVLGAEYERPVARDSDGRIVRIDGLLAHADPTLLRLVGGDPCRDLLTALGFADPVPVLESLLVKRPGDGQNYLWHQDFVHGRTGPAFVFGFYLDPAVPFEGAVQFIPAMHQERQDMHAVTEAVRTGALSVESPTVDPGDLLVHDTMTPHSSAPVGTAHGDRRVVYLEIHDRQVLEEVGMGTPEEIDARRDLLAVCREAATEAWTDMPQPASARLRAASAIRFSNSQGANYAA